MQRITETIVQFSVADKSSENAWSDLTNSISEAVVLGLEYQSGPIKTYLSMYENEYMEQYHGSDTAAKKKNGTWKYSKYLPNAYRSAKSVICRAADASLTIAGGKSYVEKMIQERNKAPKVIGIDAEISKHIAALNNLCAAGFTDNVVKQIKATWLLE